VVGGHVGTLGAANDGEAGGSDDPLNLVTICTWCHLRGVHGGRIRATGTAGHIHWELVARTSSSLIVHGRDRIVRRGTQAA
jgi:hypothetical protein